MNYGRAFKGILAPAFVLGLIAAVSPGAKAQTAPDKAADFVESLGERAVTLLSATKSDAPEERQTALKELVRAGFDLELTSQFVLGKHWHQASPKQRAEFKELFTEYLLNSYARQLGSVRADTLTVLSSQSAGQKDVLVSTSVQDIEGETNPVWRVRAVGGEYKIIDVMVDGVSLALTQRREFAAVVKRKGLEGLIQLLRQKLASQAVSARWSPSRGDPNASLLASILASPNANRIGILFAGR
jgi:phospholipid transport system substrate-binding protein